MMSELAMIFEKKGYILRSGCATGADAAFEDALYNPAKNAEIYIPNKSFPYKMGTKYKKHYIVPKEMFGEGFNGLYCQATRLIHKYDIHAGWKYLNTGIMDLHNRNMFQVLGIDLKSKSSFNICYTRGKELKQADTHSKTGGTGTSINASDLYKIKLFNLSVDEHYVRLSNFINENRELIDYNKLNSIIPRTELSEKSSNSKYENFTYQKTYKDFESIIKQDKKERDTKCFKIFENANLKNASVDNKSAPIKKNRRLKP